MMNTSLSLVAILLNSFFGLAQQEGEVNYKFQKFVLEGYFILNAVEGNLNLDTYQDAILVLARNGEDSLSNYDNPIQRKFLILTGKRKGKYQLVLESEKMIYYYLYDINFRDAFSDLAISDGSFTVGFYGGTRMRWYRGLTFTYDAEKRNWFLTEDSSGTFDSLQEDESFNTEKTLTPKDFGIISVADFDVYKD